MRTSWSRYASSEKARRFVRTLPLDGDLDAVVRAPMRSSAGSAPSGLRPLTFCVIGSQLL